MHKQNYDFHFLGHPPARSPPSLCDISISFWSCRTSLCASSTPGWFHSSSGWAALACCHPWDSALGWAGLVTAFGRLRDAQMWRALLYPLLHRQPSQNPAVPSKPSKPSQFAALTDLICLLPEDLPAWERFVHFADSVGAEGGGGREDEELGDILSI